MTAQDYILGTVKITDPAVEELVRMIKDLQKENTALKARVTKLEDDVSYYKNSKAYDGWDGGGGF